MTVYVDDVRHQFGRMVMCHMWADTLGELLAMADAIGGQRKWLQQPPKASWIHFDISLGKKELALRKGAVLTDRYGPVEFVQRQRLGHPEPEVRQRAQRMLDTIAENREMRS